MGLVIHMLRKLFQGAPISRAAPLASELAQSCTGSRGEMFGASLLTFRGFFAGVA